VKYRYLKVVLWGGTSTLRWALRRGLGLRAFALLETTGRRSGRPRQTPIGHGLVADTFWLIAAHGRQHTADDPDRPRLRRTRHRRGAGKFHAG